MKKLALTLTHLSCLLFVLVLMSMNAYGQGVNTARPLGSTSSPYGYFEYLPTDYNSNSNNYPILVFLHGRGEMGDGTTQLRDVLLHGPQRETERGRDFPFIIVSPQTPVWWNSDDINRFVEFVKNRYRVNASKVYMTGLSMGAMGTFDYAAKYPQQLAAMVPIAGKANLNTICNATSIPLWAFHGDADGTVNEQYSIDAVNKYNSCSPAPAVRAKLTLYPGVSHNSWTRTYDGSAGHDIYKWMLQYTRGGVKTTNALPTANAGANKTITLPTNSLTITGTASDSDGTISSTNWSKVSGPSATLSNASTLNLGLSNLLEGTYTFRLTVQDNDGGSKSDDVLVTVNPSSTSTGSNGLSYKFYIGSSSNPWKVIPNFSSLSPAKTGTIANVSLTPKTQSDYFGFVYEGQIQIDTQGSYTFYTYSDDGSKLYINGNLVVNNDGTHGAQERSGSVSLPAGKHAIKVEYIEYRSGETLAVRYAGPGISKRAIPNGKLFTTTSSTGSTSATSGTSSSSTGPSTGSSSLTAPSNLTADLHATGTSVYITWNDNSSNEDGFEIFMKTGSSGTYKKVGATGANKEFYTVGNLSASQTYFLKLRGKNREGFSSFTNEVSTATSSNSTTTTTSNPDQQRVLVNFNNGNNADSPWNNFNQDPDPQDRLTDLADETGAITSISLELLTPWGYESGWSGHGNHGVVTGNNSGVFEDQVLKTYFWTDRAAGEEILVKGLDAGNSYTFTFTGSRNGTGDRTTLYTINGTTVSLNAANNTNGAVSIRNVAPNAAGEIKILVKKGANASFAYLNAMVIETGSTQTSGKTSTSASTSMVHAAISVPQHEGVEGAESESDDLSRVSTISAYPNPASDFVDVRFGTDYSGTVTVQLLDMSGRTLISKTVDTEQAPFLRLNLINERLKQGLYVVKVSDGKHSSTVKITKR